MGVYDYLKGPCPDCGEEIGADSGDIQVKWFVDVPSDGDCFRTYRLGDLLPRPNFATEALPNGEYTTSSWPYCCEDPRTLFAVIKDGKFVGFTRTPVEKTHDVNFARHAIRRVVEDLECRYGP